MSTQSVNPSTIEAPISDGGVSSFDVPQPAANDFQRDMYDRYLLGEEPTVRQLSACAVLFFETGLAPQAMELMLGRPVVIEDLRTDERLQEVEALALTSADRAVGCLATMRAIEELQAEVAARAAAASDQA